MVFYERRGSRGRRGVELEPPLQQEVTRCRQPRGLGQMVREHELGLLLNQVHQKPSVKAQTTNRLVRDPVRHDVPSEPTASPREVYHNVKYFTIDYRN